MAQTALDARPATDLDLIRSASRLRIGCVCYPPLLDFHFSHDHLIVNGLYADMVEQVCRDNNITPEWVPLAWHDFEQALNGRRVDLILSAFETDARRRFAQSTAMLHRIQVGAVARKLRERAWTDRDLYSTEVRIGVTEGEIGWEYLNEYVGIDNNKHRIHVLKNSDITTIMDLLVTGRADIVLADALSCARFIEQHPKKFYNPFQTKALDVRSNGALIRQAQPELAHWLTSELKRVRRYEAIQKCEADILARYSDVVTRIA